MRLQVRTTLNNPAARDGRLEISIRHTRCVVTPDLIFGPCSVSTFFRFGTIFLCYIFVGPKCNFVSKGIQIGFEMAEIIDHEIIKMMYFVQRFHIFSVFTNIIVLEPSRDQKATLCQRASQWVSKWLRFLRTNRQTDKQTDRH